MIRPTQQATFSQIQRGIMFNFASLVRAQEQVSSGKRIVRASDDPVGAAQALAYRRQIAAAERSATAVEGARATLDTAAGLLQDAGGLMSEARATLLQAMSGTQSPDDRKVLASSIALIRERLIELGNSRSGNRYLFAGTSTDAAPFVQRGSGAQARVDYAGDEQSHEVRIGLDSRLATTLPGDEIFALAQRTGTQFSGLTGLASGASGDQGTGYAYVQVRHDATSASGLAGGVGLGNSVQDTLVGDHALQVDGVAGTVQLGNGTAVPIPAAGSPAAADLVVRDEHGAEVHLDFSSWNGASFNATLTGAASVSLDGSSWTSLAFDEPDLRLTDAAAGTVLHVDTRGLRRAGTELVTFGGTVNTFDTLQGIVDDLENIHALAPHEQQQRLAMWLGELDRNHENILNATGALGSFSQRATSLQESFDDQTAQVQSLLSGVEDVDFSQVVVEMTRAEQTLQLAQATSARLMQNTLLNFLR